MAEDRAQVLQDELDVLQSIYVGDELQTISDEELLIRVTPEEDNSRQGIEPITLALTVRYTPNYPDELPELSIEAEEGDISSEGIEELLEGLRKTGEESLGLAMVFTLASQLRDSLTDYVARKAKEITAADEARRKAEIEAEEEKFRGTAVTAERFLAWRTAYDAERKQLAKKAEEKRLRGLSAKEREEHRRRAAKPSGRQLFESGGLREEEGEAEGDADEAQEVDWSMYTREQREEQRRKDDEERREQEEAAARGNVDFSDEE